MSTPYTTTIRPDTGLYNGKLGMWLFLAAEAMFFGALFSSYAFLRTASTSWPDGADILPATPALLAVVASALAAVAATYAWRTAARPEGFPARALWVVATASLGAAALMALGLRMESSEGMTPATNTFYACWYLITVMTAAHAAPAGGYALFLLWPRDPQRGIDRGCLQNRIECLGLMLQFVALIWVATFACFYVI